MDSELLKMLKIIDDEISFRDFAHFKKIHEDFLAKKIKFIKGKYFRLFEYEMNETSLINWNEWSTYQKCYLGSLLIENHNLIVQIKIYDGDFLDGYPYEIRWEAFFKIEKEFLLIFENEINREFNRKINNLYEEQQLVKKNRALEKIRQKLLE